MPAADSELLGVWGDKPGTRPSQRLEPVPLLFSLTSFLAGLEEAGPWAERGPVLAGDLGLSVGGGRGQLLSVREIALHLALMGGETLSTPLGWLPRACHSRHRIVPLGKLFKLSVSQLPHL